MVRPILVSDAQAEEINAEVVAAANKIEDEIEAAIEMLGASPVFQIAVRSYVAVGVMSRLLALVGPMAKMAPNALDEMLQIGARAGACAAIERAMKVTVN